LRKEVSYVFKKHMKTALLVKTLEVHLNVKTEPIVAFAPCVVFGDK